MIALVNQSKKNSKGETEYKAYCNKEYLFTFYHKREDGLAIFLERASEAAKKLEVKERNLFLAQMDLLCGGGDY